MSGSKETAEPLPGVAATSGDQGAATIPTDGPTCPRRQWFKRRHDHPEQPQEPQQTPQRWRWSCWRHHAPSDGQAPESEQMPPWMQWRQRAVEAGEWPPKDWQEWREQWHKHCGWYRSRSRCHKAARVPLDDSRWLEDFYDWH